VAERPDPVAAAPREADLPERVVRLGGFLTVGAPRTKRRAAAAPMPDDEPVMRATWPASGVTAEPGADMRRV